MGIVLLVKNTSVYADADIVLPSVSIGADGGGGIGISCPSLSLNSEGRFINNQSGDIDATIGGRDAPIKSVILDIAESWGTSYCGIRSVEFYKEGSLITNENTSGFVAYSTNYAQQGLESWRAFDTSLSKTGAASDNSWMGVGDGSLRLICVFNTPVTFDEIRVNNYHTEGIFIDRGIKNVSITISTDEITNTVYDEPITNSLVIYDGQFDEHSELDAEDTQTLALSYDDEDWLHTPYSMTATGEFTAFGVVSYSLPNLFCQSSGIVSNETDYIDAVIPSLDAVFMGGGSLQEDLPVFQLEADGYVGANITADTGLPSFEIEMHTGGSAFYLMPQFSLVSSGVSGHASDIEDDFPGLSLLSFGGDSLSETLPGLSISAEATPGTSASLIFGLPPLRVSGTASRASEGGINTSMPEMRAAMTATAGIVGSMSYNLPHFRMDGDVITGIVGKVSGSFSAIWSKGSGGPSGPGTIETEFPALRILMNSGGIEPTVLRYNRRQIR